MTKHKCEGGCDVLEDHWGEVVRVNVSSDYQDWGKFWYCQNAIEYDRERGLSVKEIITLKPESYKEDNDG